MTTTQSQPALSHPSPWPHSNCSQSLFMMQGVQQCTPSLRHQFHCTAPCWPVFCLKIPLTDVAKTIYKMRTNQTNILSHTLNCHEAYIPFPIHKPLDYSRNWHILQSTLGFKQQMMSSKLLFCSLGGCMCRG